MMQINSLPPYTRSTRLLLRAPTRPGDTQALLDIYGDLATNLFNPSGPIRGLQEAETLISSWRQHWADNRFGLWAVSLLEEPDYIIGFGGLQFRELNSVLVPELQGRFRPAYWRKGYATELALTTFDVAFNQMSLPRVVCIIRPANQPSRKMLSRVGMRLVSNLEEYAGQSPSLVYELGADDHHAGALPATLQINLPTLGSEGLRPIVQPNPGLLS
ncbi:RimJ/RimL family protein N-acetyltransferase [Chitinivorax tropicus]|uniref:RimJ/RimL family protein N-acetyltransferase n=1 Tax=Chitinivorax tropicus TaxID=714531 RepID=A0A840MSH5_9PROT|nr:GNAT family N-acetyltransferase [Chitinivorax tropicus]MBB5020365.1 RimJ/RimL family protein N-acetyltransferase [Chitinivorax tropicus]